MSSHEDTPGPMPQATVTTPQKRAHPSEGTDSESIKRPRSVEGSPTTKVREEETEENILHDDLCAICHLLLYRPVTTVCNHTLCESCMQHWADVSISSVMTVTHVDENPVLFSANDVEAKCPMCRTQTNASLNAARAGELRERYPKTYAERQRDEEGDAEGNGEGDKGTVETITVYIGNKHALVRPASGSQNQHDWTFFVRPSREDIIQEIQILLHPTFRPSRIIRTSSPYSIRRLGWGYFTITALVVLKKGYSWISDDAHSSTLDETQNDKRVLPLDWLLDFIGYGGRGSMGRCRLKVRADPWVDEDWVDEGDEEDEDDEDDEE